MHLLEVVIFLVLCAVGLGWVSRRVDLPYPIALVIGGGALGFIPGLPQLDFDPQVLLVLVLPPILYQAALLTSWRDFKANLRPIGLLAIGLVIATTLAVGTALKLMVPDIPWAAAFAFGAIVSPPDAVAATAILSHLSIPRRIVTVLEGESLVNDASGLVLYKFAVAAVLTGAFSIVDASAQFALVALGGIAVGVVMARLFILVHRHLHDPFIEVLLSLSVPYMIYIVAESVNASGVLGVVAAGLVRGRYTPAMVSAEMRILGRSVWNLLVFLLNSLIFILIGLQLSGIVERLGGYSAAQLATFAVIVSLVAIAVRFAWIYPATYVPHWLLRGLREREPAPPAREVFVESWCGMRGIVSLAAALALPVQVNTGAAFPYRDLIIFLTFVVIAVTLVVQGLTLAPLIRRLGIGKDRAGEEELQRARLAIGAAARAVIERCAAEDGAPPELVRRIQSEFAERFAPANAGDGAAAREAQIAKRLRIAAVRAERAELIRIWRDNQISDDVLHEVEEELDYRESHA